MKEIKVNIPEVRLPGIPEINIQFLNGVVNIPGRSGGYVIASGCGSGKTTAIRQIILSEFNKGVIYSASTINECNEMYQFLVQNGEPYGLTKDDIIVLHSDYTAEGVDMNMFRNNPKELANKKVIICTHIKLLNEYPESLMAYNRNILRKSRMSLLSRGKFSFDENGIKKYPRQYVLIDEMPTCTGFSFNVTRDLIRLLGVADVEERVDEEGKTYTTARLPIHYTNGNNYEITEELYKGSGLEIFNNSTESGRLKSRLALSMIYEDYDGLINALDNMDGTKPFIKMSYTIADQIASGNCQGETRYIIFDGTGDLTFIPYDNGYSPFSTLTYGSKYNSPITMNKIVMGYKRVFRTERDFYSKRSSILDNIRIQVDNIVNIINENHKLLIVTWKDFKVKKEGRGLPIEDYDVREIPYPEYLRLEIEKRSKISGVDFEIIHYQSGLDKATNKFREYDSIMFLGEFHVPNDVVSQFNMDYKVFTNPDNYLIYQLVQAVCRTRIRNHKGEGINIYFTDDWDEMVMNNLVSYLSLNNVSEVRNTTLNHIKPKWRPVIELFCNLSNEFKDAIEIEGKFCRIKFTLDEIWNLTRDVLPISEKKLKKYYSLINYLKGFGIDLVIESTWGNNQYSK